MDIRVLRYYLTVCREGTMSRAAEVLHVTQPTLSRQIADLERELGAPLLERHSRSVVPTEKGLYLKRRAEEIVALADQTAADFATQDDIIEGDVFIGAGESDLFRILAAGMQVVREEHPQVHFYVRSGDSADAVEWLERGLVDFALLFSYPNIERYESIRLKQTDAWGILMPDDAPLAKKDTIGPADLEGQPLIVSSQAHANHAHDAWFGDSLDKLNIVAEYNLMFNGAMMVREGLGYVLGLDKIAPTGKGSGLAFRLLYPPMVAHIDFAWKRDTPLSNASEKFLEVMREKLA